MIRTYLKKRPEIKEFWLQSKDVFSLCRVDNFDDMNNFGDWKIKRVEEPPEEGEVITLVVG